MRIQHNIPAMNSYRNYNNNVSKVSKSLEKLSTGYRVNRAGDDAAGLAISEKMRIQMTGLEQAQTNAKAGINLVQTAEGALTEVHDMLNRMYTLAEQSANGTYDNTTDRKQLQKEVASLRTEIDRIADSSNYNGIKLLDGSLDQGGTTGVEIVGDVTVSSEAGGASKAAYDGAVFDAANLKKGSGTAVRIDMTDDKGNAYTVTLEQKDQTLVDKATGKTYAVPKDDTAAEDIYEDMIASATGGAYKGSVSGKALSIESVATGSNAGRITALAFTTIAADGTETKVDPGALTITEAASGKKKLSGVTAVTTAMSADTAKSKVFSVNGQKFALAAATTSAADLKSIQAAVGEDVKILLGAQIGDAAGQLAQYTGLNVTKDSDDVKIDTGSGKALSLQIGDTAESFNRLEVSIKDVHASSLGIGGINIGNQSDAAAAMNAIKNATNIVSDIRGGLGALQNRLDHTIKNLSVSEENITEAESTIRDTDVAKEMMQYTKNNILVQSAQAMLAQANQLPQGVLQLLG